MNINKILFLILYIFILSQAKGFIFSVIIAIYNTGRYLDDSINSLIHQTIGFQKIQIILVNDGSTDNSEEKCAKYQKKYPNNIIYIKIEHGGVSKARNIGMEYASGKYINFLDADDKWDYRSLKYIFIFFELYKNIDIVAGRLKLFEAVNTFHPLDYKFYKTRIVNLTEEYNCIHISGPSTFFKNSLIKGKKFSEDIFSGEDTIFINNILLLKPIIGYIREAIYFYRKRSDHSSAVQNQVRKVDFYFSQLKNVGQYLIDKSKELYNKISPFIQFYIGYNILFRILSPAFKFLNTFDFNEYCKLIEGQLRQIEDKYILEQIFTSYKAKLFALSKKYNKDVRYDILYQNESLIYSGKIMINLNNINKNIIIWRFLEIKQNILHLEGKDNLYLSKEKYHFYAKIGNKIFFPNYYDYSGFDFYTMYGLSYKGQLIIFDIPINNMNQQIISFFLSYCDNIIEIFPSLGTYTHIPSLKEGYYSNGNYIIKIIQNRLNIYRYNKTLENSFEEQYCKELKNLSKDNITEIRTIYIKYRDSNKRKKIWLINDKQDKAGDNGEFFFRYLMNKNIQDTEIYFVIKKDCEDYKRLKKFRNILSLSSKNYLSKFLNTDKIITSISDSWVTNAFGLEQKYVKDLLHFDIVFIPSGIIKDDLSYNLNKVNKNFSLFVTSSKKEYNYILSSKFGYDKKNVILTGLSRFDNLKNLSEIISKDKIILIIPAWRSYISGTRDLVTSQAIYSDNFKNTTFFIFYNNLMKESKLNSIMEKFNYTGILCLHPYFSKQAKDFTINKYFSIKSECNYQELLIRSSLFITDYSSLFFDFVYINKPIIYTHFDILEYRKSQLSQSYFEYYKNGFGPVCLDVECTVKEIIKQIQKGCILSNYYFKKKQQFFAFSDKNNNERIFQKIINGNKTRSYLFKYILILFCNFLIYLKLRTRKKNLSIQ